MQGLTQDPTLNQTPDKMLSKIHNPRLMLVNPIQARSRNPKLGKTPNQKPTQVSLIRVRTLSLMWARMLSQSLSRKRVKILNRRQTHNRKPMLKPRQETPTQKRTLQLVLKEPGNASVHSPLESAQEGSGSATAARVTSDAQVKVFAGAPTSMTPGSRPWSPS
jgi:hypothetical protein